VNGRIVLVDFDIYCYAAGFSCQKTTYIYNDEEFPTKTALKEKYPSYDPEELRAFTQVEPASHAIQCARMMLQGVLDACAPVASYKGYLTGPGNFRYDVATIQPYKGNRTQPKPVHFEAIRDFLIRECNAELVEGVEADDMLIIEWSKNPHNTVVASIDKDLAQVPGLTLYNWKHKTLHTLTEEEATYNFYKQLLTGDDTDNIPGVSGIGDGTAKKLLKMGMPETLMMTVCYSQYLKAYGKEKAWSALEENAKLLYLLRNEEQLANPKNAWQPCIKPDGVL